MNRNEKKLLAIAYHEAGHAVAAWQLELAVGITTIVPDEDDGTLGHCVVKIPKWLPEETDYLKPRTRWMIERRVICLLAGSEAERLFTGRYNHKCANRDYRNAMNLASHIHFDPKPLGVYLRLQGMYARQIVTQQQWKPCIEAVARELIEKKTLRPTELTRIIREAIDREIKQAKAER
jgi:ATP-dependent Zn protease